MLPAGSTLSAIVLNTVILPAGNINQLCSDFFIAFALNTIKLPAGNIKHLYLPVLESKISVNGKLDLRPPPTCYEPKVWCARIYGAPRYGKECSCCLSIKQGKYMRFAHGNYLLNTLSRGFPRILKR